MLNSISFKIFFVVALSLQASTSLAVQADTTVNTPSTPESDSLQNKTHAKPSFTLKPHTATYSARFKKGINIKGSGVRELKSLGNGEWLYRFDIDSLPVDIRESVKFIWQEDYFVQPTEYNYTRKGFFIKNKARSIVFDWNNRSANGQNNGNKWQLEIPLNAFDKLSYQLQLLADISLNRRTMDYQITHKGRLEDSRFRKLKEETLQTKIGTQESVVVEKIRSPEKQRKTLLWFSKSNPLLLLRMYQQEKDGEEYEITIESFKQ